MSQKIKQLRPLMFRVLFFLHLIAVMKASNAAYELSKDLSQCMESAINQGATINVYRITCLNIELKAQERALQILNNKHLTQIKTDQKKLLSQSHSRWLKYRDAWCHHENSFSKAAPDPNVNELFCKIDLTSDQIKYFERN